MEAIFKIFNHADHFIELLETVARPVVHFCVCEPSQENLGKYDTIESSSSGTAIIIESIETGEWFVIKPGHIRLDGSLGSNNGPDRFQGVVRQLQERAIKFAVWVAPKNTYSQLVDGITCWPSIKSDLVPIRAFRLESRWKEDVLSTIKKSTERS